MEKQLAVETYYRKQETKSSDRI